VAVVQKVHEEKNIEQFLEAELVDFRTMSEALKNSRGDQR